MMKSGFFSLFFRVGWFGLWQWIRTGALAGLLAVTPFASRVAGQTAEAPMDEAYLFTPAGFDRAGVPIWAKGERTGLLEIVVRDALTGEPTPCRVNVVGADGNYYQPPANRLSQFALTGTWPQPGSWGNRVGKAPHRYVGRFFYMTGETSVAVPAGAVRIEVWKGLEFRPETVTVQVSAAQSRRIEISLTRTAPMAGEGYYSGDSHLHLPRQSEEDDEILFDLLEAEDLRYGGVLAYNHPAGPYSGVMDTLAYPQRFLGASSIRSRGDYHLVSGQEYRNATYGHLNLFLLDDLVYPGEAFNANHWPLHGDIGRAAMGRGGFAMPAHGGYAQAIWADAALGAINGVELLQFGVYRGIELDGWYNMLNSGYRFSAHGASDYPPCRTLADCRTYVYHSSAPTASEWIAGLAAGRSFFTTGPLLLLEVDGEKPGAQIRKAGAGPHPVKVRVRALCEVTPITDLELIVNGRVVKNIVLSREEGQGRWIELEETLELSESSWIAARAYSESPSHQPDAEAHTNPVYVYLDGRAPFRRGGIDGWIARIDEQITAHTQRAFPERAQVLLYFQQARDFLLKVRQDGGLPADADPAQLAAEFRVDMSVIGPPAAEGGAPDATEAMKAFLRPVPVKSPQEALREFETVEGFHMELVAAEPLVVDPIAGAFDENGNLYVTEMRDYPYRKDQPVRVAWQKLADPDEPFLGTVRLLRDTNGDGRMDESHLFAEDLPWAGGIIPWRGGVFVAASPDIWYLKDTTGDFRADVREKVFTGFGTQNQQLIVNGLQFGLDHLIYGNSGGSAGEVRPANDPAAEPIPMRGRDFRFHPDSLRFETQTGSRQFGTGFDDWGNRFLCSQAEPAFHVVLPLEYLERNPFFTPAATIHRTHDSPTPIYRISPVETWRHVRSSRRVAASERSAGTAGVSHHVVDAAAGMTVYRGGAYPEEYYGSLFVGDSVSNLVHRRVLVPEGATFRTERGEPEGSEFVRSSDIWFRPVNFINAPDGTLYCLDMSRELSETINIPPDVEKHLDLASGRDRGRIYRMAPSGFRSPAPPRLGTATTAELVAALESPHGWWRDTAHRLLYERQDESAVPLLVQLASGSASPQARVHALWSLRGLGGLSDGAVMTALSDSHPGVRENAVRLAEPRLDASAELRGSVARLAWDPEPRVRLQVAFSVGESRRWDQPTLLAEVVRGSAADPWIRAAALSSAEACSGELFELLARDKAFAAHPDGLEFLRQLSVVIGAQNRPPDLERVIRRLSDFEDLSAAYGLVGALAEGLQRSGSSIAAADPQGRMLPLFRRAPQLAMDPNQPEALRTVALEGIGLLPFAEGGRVLLEFLRDDQPRNLRLAAIEALAQYREPSVGRDLLSVYPKQEPALQGRILAVLLERSDRLEVLWEGLEMNVIHRDSFSPGQVEFLRNHADNAVREKAAGHFGIANAATREDVFRSFLPAVQLEGFASRGRALAETRCLVCHTYRGRGVEFGPDLTGSRAGGKEKFLASVIDPSREVLPQYFSYLVETRDKETILGIIKQESEASVTLLQAGGHERTLARANIASMQTQSRSIMPDGLEAGMSVQEMADLIEYFFSP